MPPVECLFSGNKSSRKKMRKKKFWMAQMKKKIQNPNNQKMKKIAIEIMNAANLNHFIRKSDKG